MSHQCERLRVHPPGDPLSGTRRHVLPECGRGLGKIALASLLSDAFASRAAAAPGPRPGTSDPLIPRPPHFAPKAKRVIHLFMAGAPSQLDLFDYKPTLTRYEGKPIPPSVIG